MNVSCRKRSVMSFAVAGGLSGLLAGVYSAWGQQISTDTVAIQSADDSNTATTCGLNSAESCWPAGDNPATTTGVAFVDTQKRIRTPSGTTNVTVAADSFTLISINPSSVLASTTDSGVGLGSLNLGTDGAYAYLTLKGAPGPNTTTINNLVLANGGVLFNYADNEQTIAGNMFLVPAGATSSSGSGINGDGITTTVSGGIVDTHGNNLSGISTAYAGDNYFNIASNISGGGMLRIENTGGGTSGSTFVPQVVTLSGSNTFSGGVVLDGTSTVGITGNGPDLAVDSPTALGTGTLTILPTSYVGDTAAAGAPGLAIDNLTGASETLTTNNPQKWFGSFTFAGTNSLDMGSGPVTMGANVTLTTAASTLALEGVISGSYSLTKAGAGTLVLNGNNNYTGTTNVSAGTLIVGRTGTTGAGTVNVQAALAYLGGTGDIPGAVNILSGGTLAPALGPLGPGSLEIDGALTLQPGSTLAMELTPTVSDQLALALPVTLTGSTLNITLAPGYTPAIGTVFDIVDDVSTLPNTGTFANDNGGFITDAEGDTYAINYDNQNVAGEVGNGQDDVTLTFISAPPVPEPASVGLLGIGVLGLLGRRRL